MFKSKGKKDGLIDEGDEVKTRVGDRVYKMKVEPLTKEPLTKERKPLTKERKPPTKERKVRKPVGFREFITEPDPKSKTQAWKSTESSYEHSYKSMADGKMLRDEGIKMSDAEEGMMKDGKLMDWKKKY